jgi:hypothetical protein
MELPLQYADRVTVSIISQDNKQQIAALLAARRPRAVTFNNLSQIFRLPVTEL